MPRRYLALFLPWLPAERARRAGLAPPDAPFALIGKQRGALRIVALDPVAARLGLEPDLALADARARVPELASLPHVAEEDAALLDRLAHACLRYGPSVTAEPPDGLMLDITGCAHLHGGEEMLRSNILVWLAGQRLTARAAMASTPDAARALARFGGEDVRGLPLAALEVEADIQQALRRAGFHMIGDLAPLPRAPLAARFGMALPTLLARLLGEEDPHITPHRPREPVRAELRFAEPVGRTDDVLDAIEALVVQAAIQLGERGEGGRAFAIGLHRSDRHVARLTVETGAPTCDPALVLRLLRERIDSLADPLDPGFGYDSIDLCVPRAEPLTPDQPELEKKKRGTDEVGPLRDRLAVRYGSASVLGFTAGDSHLPERAAMLRPAGSAPGSPPWSPPATGEPPLRPLMIFDPPQRIEVLAAVPDGPPRRFRWRGTSHLVTAQEGPERIAPEWWRRRGGHAGNPGLTRDYYRVEDADGRRFWLFRHGLFAHETNAPIWYVHGLFA